MASYRTSRVLPVMLILIVIAIAIASLVSIARVMFPFDPASTSQIAQVQTNRDNLLNSSVDHAVKMTVRGPIVADEVFRSYTIAISTSSRVMTTYKGYTNTKIDEKKLGNGAVAYEQFIYALEKANLVKGKPLDGDSNDTRGVCASGDLYNFELITGDKTTSNLWASSCSDVKGSLDAKPYIMAGLFNSQIPGSDTLIRSIDL